jgi:PKHD-type hydroxylase
MENYTWHLDLDKANETWAYWNDIFTTKECNDVIDLCKNENFADWQRAKVGGNPDKDDAQEDDSIRRSNIAWVRVRAETRWIFERITHAVNNINEEFFNFDLKYIENLQFTEYEASDTGFYTKHIDTMYKSVGTRKLSFSIQLSDPDDYKGGKLLLHTGADPIELPNFRGTCSFFPSWSLHEVTPVTEGVRHALVGWVIGPRFR